MKVITASSKHCNKVCGQLEQCMSEYLAGVKASQMKLGTLTAEAILFCTFSAIQSTNLFHKIFERLIRRQAKLLT